MIDDSPKTNRRLFAALLAVLGVALLAWLLWPARRESAAANKVEEKPAAKASEERAEEKKEKETNRVELTPEAIARGQIETAVVTTQAFRQTIEAPGRLALNEDSVVRAGTIVGGRVTRVLATVGDYVKKNQALVYLHSHELIDARGAEAKARAVVAEKEKALAYAKAELERAERLLEAKAIARREHAQAQANVAAVTSELEYAQAELTRAAEFLEHLTVPHDSHDDIVIYSPINGFVTKRNVSVGTVVTEATDLIQVADLSTLWAIAEVPEKQAALVYTGQSVEVKIPAFAERRFTGRVVRLGDTLDPATRTVQVRCLIQNQRGQLRPEMTATISLDSGAAQPALTVPREAVQEINGERVVFLALGDGAFEKQIVQTGREQDNFIEITNGLAVNQRIVTRGAFFIKSAFLKGTMAEE